MPRIAFVSCVRIPYKDAFDRNPPCVLDASEFEQPVWAHLLEQHLKTPFDAMLFLGDQVYTDYGQFHGGGNRPLKKNWSPDLFHRLLYTMYSAQYTKVSAFRRLMQRLHDDGVQIGMIWDDHDFGYNNGNGMELKFRNKLGSTKVLFEQFLNTVMHMPSAYPAMPAIPTMTPTQGIERIHNPITLGGNVEIVLLDGRFYRDVQVGGGASLLGAQWPHLKEKLESLPQGRLMIVCLGSPYSQTTQSWASNGSPYANYDEFTALASAKHILFLTGDIHKNKLIPQQGFTEVISSGAHLPSRFFDDIRMPPNQHCFGLLDIDDTQIDVKLVANNRVEISQTISRATGMPS
jgi:PhoD-like phosphatase